MEKVKRSSNFELLRIVAIIMIILFHIQLHGPQPQLTADNKYFALPVFYKRLIVFEIVRPFGAVGNSIFLIISGYFLIKNNKLDVGKISKKLLLQIGFSTVVLMLSYALFITFFSDKNNTFTHITIQNFNNSWWFVGYYFLVVICARLFLNNVLRKVDKTQYISFLLAILGLTQFTWSGTIIEGLIPGMRTLMVGIFLYSLGGYISIYNPYERVKTIIPVIVIVMVYLIRLLSAYNITAYNIDRYLKNGSEGYFIQYIQDSFDYEISVVIIAICVFELFRRLKIPYNKMINYLAQTTLMIYFIHENEFFICFYKYIDWIQIYEINALKYFAGWMVWGGISFVLGVIAYAVFTSLMRLFSRSKSIVIKKGK